MNTKRKNRSSKRKNRSSKRKFSKYVHSNSSLSEGKVNWGKVGLALFAWGMISFLIAGYFAISQKTDRYDISMLQNSSQNKMNVKPGVQPANQIGPILVEKPGETFEIFVRSGVPANRWAFIETEIVDQNEEYLYSFGQELWHETGRDSDGAWRERRSNFDTNITFPQPGLYYINFWTNKSYKTRNDKMRVVISKRNGSSVLHNWLGIILIVIGLVMIEIQWGVFAKTLETLNEQN